MCVVVCRRAAPLFWLLLLLLSEKNSRNGEQFLSGWHFKQLLYDNLISCLCEKVHLIFMMK